MNFIKLITDVRSLIGLLAVLGAFAVWAADTRYVTQDKLSDAQKASEVRQINREIQDLEIQKGYTLDQRQVKMIEARIAVKQNQIKDTE